jgi:hypothetical protein
MLLVASLDKCDNCTGIIDFLPDGGLFGIGIVHRDEDGGKSRRVVGFDNVADFGTNLSEVFDLLDTHSDFRCLLSVTAAFEIDPSSEKVLASLTSLCAKFADELLEGGQVEMTFALGGRNAQSGIEFRRDIG